MGFNKDGLPRTKRVLSPPKTISWLTEEPPPLRKPDERLLTNEKLIEISDKYVGSPMAAQIATRDAQDVKTASILKAQEQDRVDRILKEIEEHITQEAGKEIVILGDYKTYKKDGKEFAKAIWADWWQKLWKKE